jgi:hypothetical protein
MLDTGSGVLLVPSNADHGPTCGERIPCPLHGQPLGPHYLPAERQRRRFVTLVFAHDCGYAWRETPA